MEYRHDTEIGIEFGPIFLSADVRIFYDVAFGQPATHTGPATSDEVEINRIEFKTQLNGGTYRDIEHAPAAMKDSVGLLVGMPKVAAELVASAHVEENNRVYDRADYLYDAARDRSLES